MCTRHAAFHTRGMSRYRLATAAVVVGLGTIVPLGVATGPAASAGPAAADGPREAAGVTVTATNVDWDLSLAGLVGATTSGTVTAHIRNEGATTIRRRVVLVFDGQTTRSSPLTLAPGAELAVQLDVVAAAPSWGRHEIEVRYGHSQKATASWQLPWLLIATAAAALHLLALSARDRVRRWLLERAEGGVGVVRQASG